MRIEKSIPKTHFCHWIRRMPNKAQKKRIFVRISSFYKLIKFILGIYRLYRKPKVKPKPEIPT